MTSDEISAADMFRVRLNELFAASGHGRTNRMVVRGLEDQGCRISASYISQLRRGTRRSPSGEIVAALSRYFGVPASHFYTSMPGNRHVQVDEDNAVLNRLDDDALRTVMLLANGLSPEAIDLLTEVASMLSLAEGRRV